MDGPRPRDQLLKSRPVDAETSVLAEQGTGVAVKTISHSGEAEAAQGK
jgi:hypothetical protein